MATTTKRGVRAAVQTFTAEIDGQPITVKDGERRLADDPAVKAFPDLFYDEADPTERERKLRKSAQQAVDETAARPRPMVAKWKSRKKITLDVDGEKRVIEKGELLPAGDELLALIPGSFERTIGEL
jgi:hypothetical protein